MIYPNDWVDDPPSKEIAEILTVSRAVTCPHGRSRCDVQCGVARHGTPLLSHRYDPKPVEWYAISIKARRKWIKRYNHVRKRQARKNALRARGTGRGQP